MPLSSVLTIGHSTRSLDEFIELLIHHHITMLVDVRTVPASRRVPHFAKPALERSLPQYGVRYVHIPELGGLRKPKPDSINRGWRNVSFRGYADYIADGRLLGRDRQADRDRPLLAFGRPPHEWGGVAGHHVRRGGAVALPSLPHLGCARRA